MITNRQVQQLSLQQLSLQHRAWWLRPTTVQKYQHQNHRFLSWDSYSGLGAKFGNYIWTFPIPEPRESFFEWSRNWIVRRTPPMAFRQTLWNPRGYRLFGPKRDGYQPPKISLFEKAQENRQWDWELRVRHIFEVPSKDSNRFWT